MFNKLIFLSFDSTMYMLQSLFTRLLNLNKAMLLNLINLYSHNTGIIGEGSNKLLLPT